MGTYTFLKLKPSITNQQVHKINAEIEALGFHAEVHESIKYGAFVTTEQIVEDARYMNEDPQGLKQAGGWPRPVTPEYIERNWEFLQRKQFCRKLGDEMENTAIVLRWASQNQHLIDQQNSSYWEKEQIQKLCPSLADMI